MDRLFVLQKSYVNDRYDPDGICLLHLLEQYHRRTMDEFFVTNDIETLAGRCKKYTEKNWKIIPVGTLEFVRACMNAILGVNDFYMKPIEVPEVLRDYRYTGRPYTIIEGKEISEYTKQHGSEFFIKDADHLKSWNNLLIDGNCSQCINNDTHYVVSRWVNLLSEYRMFVCRDAIIGIQNYLGDPCVFPNRQMLQQMVGVYSQVSHPGSYTMDVGVCNDTSLGELTIILEVHPFTSCGLYGMYDRKLLDMFEDGIDWYKQQNC